MTFAITPEMLETVNEQGVAIQEAGTFTVTIGGASPGARSVELGAAPPTLGRFTLE